VNAFEIVAALLVTAASFAYLNHRFIHRPPAIALMAMSLGVSLLLLIVDRLGWVAITPHATHLLERVALSDTLLHGVLGILLFAGALHVNVNDLWEEKGPVASLAIGGTVLSTFVVGGLAFFVLRALGLGMSFGHCMLFGALISPTDPIAVVGILKRARLPKKMETEIAGESMFNDGVGVVLFLSVLGVLSRGDVSAGHVVLLFAREAIGGVLFGLATGYLTYRLLKSIDHYQTELLLTLALVLGGYALAERIHISAPLAAVTAGLLIGNQGRVLGMSDVTRDHLDKFWSLVDEIINALLFVLVGFEVLRLTLSGRALAAGGLMIAVTLFARFVSVVVPIAALSPFVKFAHGSIRVLTWAGLRGGISVALALSTPPGAEHDLIVVMTYCVVVFSILVQGMTLAPLVRRLVPAP
jgi:CPA1 family monovalent cation:H+ antiporter